MQSITLFQIILLAMIQGAAELLPISSSAHVILAEKWMGIDPSTPAMTFFLVLLHTGTMFSVLIYYGSRWKRFITKDFIRSIFLATACTGVLGLGLKIFIEKVILEFFLGESHAEIESLFKSLLLISISLLCVGVLMIYTGSGYQKRTSKQNPWALKKVMYIGLIQGLCLPFRGFSRSGATISMALLCGFPRRLAEDFSFALAVMLTPPVILLQAYRLLRTSGGSLQTIYPLIYPGMIGMCFSFITGLLTLRFLSHVLERGRWIYFGFYCVSLAMMIFIFNHSF